MVRSNEGQSQSAKRKQCALSLPHLYRTLVQIIISNFSRYSQFSLSLWCMVLLTIHATLAFFPQNFGIFFSAFESSQHTVAVWYASCFRISFSLSSVCSLNMWRRYCVIQRDAESTCLMTAAWWSCALRASTNVNNVAHRHKSECMCIGIRLYTLHCCCCISTSLSFNCCVTPGPS